MACREEGKGTPCKVAAPVRIGAHGIIIVAHNLKLGFSILCNNSNKANLRAKPVLGVDVHTKFHALKFTACMR